MSKTKTTTETTTETANAAEEKKTFKTIEEENAYYNEPVKIKLFKDNDKYNSDVFVAVNGVGMLVPRGKEVEIPRKYVAALKNSEMQDCFTAEYQDDLQESNNATELSE